MLIDLCTWELRFPRRAEALKTSTTDQSKLGGIVEIEKDLE